MKTIQRTVATGGLDAASVVERDAIADITNRGGIYLFTHKIDVTGIIFMAITYREGEANASD